MGGNVVTEKDPFGWHAGPLRRQQVDVGPRLGRPHLVAEDDLLEVTGQDGVTLGEQVLPVWAAGIGEDSKAAAGAFEAGDHREHVDLQREHVTGCAGQGFGIGGCARSPGKLTVKLRPVDLAAFDPVVQPPLHDHGADGLRDTAADFGHLPEGPVTVERYDDVSHVEKNEFGTHRFQHLSPAPFKRGTRKLFCTKPKGKRHADHDRHRRSESLQLPDHPAPFAGGLAGHAPGHRPPAGRPREATGRHRQHVVRGQYLQHAPRQTGGESA